MAKKTIFGTCVGNPFDTVERLSDVIDNAVPISKEEFLRNCDVTEGFEPDHTIFGGQDLKKTMKEFPNDFEYYKGVGKDRGIYFFTHSAIEHFYK
jgi:hypothetical protein